MPIREISDVEMNIAKHLKKFSYQQHSLPYCLDYTELLMKLIGKAYADGELELPGEVGRFVWRDWSDKIQTDFDDWFDLVDKGMTFIALRKEEDFTEFIMTETEAAIEGGIIDENTGLPFGLEGTGKEEEK